jgi:hypothetical protein
MIIPAGTLIVRRNRARRSSLTQKDNLRIGCITSRGWGGGRQALALIPRRACPWAISPEGKGIEEGKAYPGMTREGILTALGYPATHRTPSLDAGTWVYWTNRFGTLAVEFDAKGNVTKVTD